MNRLGRRFCDESRGDEVSNQALLAQPEARGVLLCDERVRTEYVVSEPPFHALEVWPAITFTYGGLRSDKDGHVLDHDGVQVNGLWAAGVDAGGCQTEAR